MNCTNAGGSPRWIVVHRCDDRAIRRIDWVSAVPRRAAPHYRPHKTRHEHGDGPGATGPPCHRPTDERDVLED